MGEWACRPLYLYFKSNIFHEKILLHEQYFESKNSNAFISLKTTHIRIKPEIVKMTCVEVNWDTIGSGNGLSSVRHQPITKTNVDLLSTRHSVKSE